MEQEKTTPTTPDSPFVSMSETTVIEMGWRETGGTKKENARSEIKDTDKAKVEEPENSNRKHVIRLLDELDGRVSHLRSEALKLQLERDQILSSLDTIMASQLMLELKSSNDFEELSRYMNSINERCADVNIELHTERSNAELESLNLVNNMIDSLIRSMHTDRSRAKVKCMSFINSCFDDIIDQNVGKDLHFEEAVLSCTSEDQRRIKQRLGGLYTYFSSVTTLSFKEMADDETNNGNNQN